MRTNDPRVTPSTRLLGYLSAASVMGFALAACSSSTHLDPPGAAATGAGGGSAATTTTGVGGAGGSEPIEHCVSNAQCSTFPKTICDTVTNMCQQCLVDADCALKGGPVCQAGVCGCPTKGETFCGVGTAKTCVDTVTSQANCGSCGHECFGACADGKCADPWEQTSTVDAPDARTRHVAVWDSSHSLMIVWGGRTATGPTASGGVYDLAKNTWTKTSMANAPSPRLDATAVWDDAEKAMIVWGGNFNGTPLGTGALYDPVKNTWKTISNVGAPSARWRHTAVWTGAEMIVWGGFDGTAGLGDGSKYMPSAGTWMTVEAPAAPTPRYDHTAVWTGAQMLVWGGEGYDAVAMANVFLADGGNYDPKSATPWVAIPVDTTLQPSGRSQATAVWTTAMSMIIWGGVNTTGSLGDGSKYASGEWLQLNNPSPTARTGHSAVMIAAKSGDRMMIWGGSLVGANYLNSGALLDQKLLKWTLDVPTGPVARSHHTAVVTGEGNMLGSKMIIWGGDVSGGSGLTNTGAIFDASTM
jgi:hypothetical protein